MYTRDPNNKNRPQGIRVPSNYSGTVFRDEGMHRYTGDIDKTREDTPENSADRRIETGARIPQIKERAEVPKNSAPVKTAISPLGESVMKGTRPTFESSPSTVQSEGTNAMPSSFPAGYGGNLSPEEIEVATPAKPEEDTAMVVGDRDKDRDRGKGEGEYNPLKSLFASLMPPGIGRRDKEHEFGFEELLIIALILLISQSDDDSDILLLLTLLLFF